MKRRSVRAIGSWRAVLAFLCVASFAFGAKATPSLDFDGMVRGSEFIFDDIDGQSFFFVGALDGNFLGMAIVELVSLAGIPAPSLRVDLVRLERVSTSYTLETVTTGYRSVGNEFGANLLDPQGAVMAQARDIELRVDALFILDQDGNRVDTDNLNSIIRGSFELVPFPGNALGAAYGDEIFLLTNGTMRVAFTVDLTFQAIDFDFVDYQALMSQVPVIPSAGFEAGFEQEVELLGGAGAPGGLGVMVSPNTPGAISVEHDALTQAELNDRLLAGQQATFRLPGERTQLWQVQAQGGLEFDTAILEFTYDDSNLGPAFSEFDLRINHFSEGRWQALEQCRPGRPGECWLNHNVLANRITVRVESFSPFAVGQVPEPASRMLHVAAVVALFGVSRRRASVRR